VFDAEAERQPPVLPGDTFGDQATGGEVPFAQRDSDDHQQREHNRRDKNQQQEVRREQAQLLRFGLNHSHNRYLP
jgi:hypothetical protein